MTINCEILAEAPTELRQQKLPKTEYLVLVCSSYPVMPADCHQAMGDSMLMGELHGR